MLHLARSGLILSCAMLSACGGAPSSSTQAHSQVAMDCSPGAAVGSGLKMAAIGDSITQGTSYGGVKPYHAVLGERLKFDEVRNLGVGGAAYVKVTGHTSMTDIYLQMDPDVDVVLVFAGINDLTNPLGEPEDLDPSTVYGALNTVFSGLKAKFPGKAVGVIIPLGYLEAGDTRLGPVMDAVEERAQFHQLPYFDLYRKAPFQPGSVSDREKFMPDGLHPNAEGHLQIAKVLEPFVHDLAASVRQARCAG